MLTFAPASVMLIGIFGMFVIAFAVTRMTLLERAVPSRASYEPSKRVLAGSGV